MNHAALTQAIAAIALHHPEIADRLRHSLAIVLAGIEQSPWPEVTESFSRLTGDGFPVEFTLTSLEDGIRYAAEVAGPEVQNVDRLVKAQEILQRLKAPELPDSLRSRLEILQASGPLRYGTWLGVRHSPAGDRYKLYSEVPAVRNSQGDHIVREWMESIPRLLDRAMMVQMIGYDLSNSRQELYLRTEGLEVWELTWLLRQLALGDRAEEVCAYLEQLGVRSAANLLSGSIGLSLSLSASGESGVVSLFGPARHWIGRDAQVRSRLLAMFPPRVATLYAALTTPLQTATDWNTHHGILSLIVPPRGPLGLAIGWRPPGLNEGVTCASFPLASTMSSARSL